MTEKAGAKTHDAGPLRQRAVLALHTLLAVLRAASPILLLLAAPSNPAARYVRIIARKNHTKTLEAPGHLRDAADPNGEALRGISYTQPKRGGVMVYTSGVLRVRPDHNLVGRTSLGYWIGDGTGLRDCAPVALAVRP